MALKEINENPAELNKYDISDDSEELLSYFKKQQSTYKHCIKKKLYTKKDRDFD